MKNKKEELVRDEILRAAQKLFQQYGLRKTTMDEIAVACSKAKSTLYHYFDSKEQMFDEVLEMEIVTIRQKVKNKVEEHRLMVDKLKAYIMEFYNEVVERINVYRILRQDLVDTYNSSRRHYFRIIDFEQKYIVRILEDGYDSGEYKEVEREDIEWIAEIFIASFLGIVSYSVEREGSFNSKKLESTVNEIIPKLF